MCIMLYGSENVKFPHTNNLHFTLTKLLGDEMLFLVIQSKCK